MPSTIRAVEAVFNPHRPGSHGLALYRQHAGIVNIHADLRLPQVEIRGPHSSQPSGKLFSLKYTYRVVLGLLL